MKKQFKKKRTNEGEFTSESGTNIGFLSSSFAFFTQSETLLDSFVVSFRRVLCFGVYRTFALCEKTFSILQRVLSNGRAAVLQCLIRLRKVFLKCEPNYLFNILFVDPLLFFVQQEKEEVFEVLSRQVSKFEIKRSDLGLKIDIWEQYLKEIGNGSESDSSEEGNSEASSDEAEAEEEPQGKSKEKPKEAKEEEKEEDEDPRPTKTPKEQEKPKAQEKEKENLPKIEVLSETYNE